MDCGNHTYPTICYHLRSLRCYLSRSQATVVVRVHKRKSLDSNRFYKSRKWNGCSERLWRY